MSRTAPPIGLVAPLPAAALDPPATAGTLAVPLALLAVALLLAVLAAKPPTNRRGSRAVRRPTARRDARAVHPSAGRGAPATGPRPGDLPRRGAPGMGPRADHLPGWGGPAGAGPPAAGRGGLAVGPSTAGRGGLAGAGPFAAGRGGLTVGPLGARRGRLAVGPFTARRGRWRRGVGAAMVLAIAATVVKPGLAVLPLGVSAAWLVAVRTARRRAAAQRLEARAAAAPAVLDLLGAGLRAGLNPHLAVLRVAERTPDALRAELAEAAAVLRLGGTPAAALQVAADRSGLDELRAAAAALQAAERWGAPPAEALAARAEALRTRARLRAEAEAGRAAVRLAFPLVLCFLPAFVLLTVVPTVAGALRSLAP
jgi:Type II secretion system (T2SS), protein F